MANLQVSFLSTPEVVAPGQLIAYLVTVANIGEDSVTPVTVQIDWPAGLALFPGVSQGTIDQVEVPISDNGMNHFTVDTLPTGQVLNLSFSALVDDFITAATLTTTITVNEQLSASETTAITVANEQVKPKMGQPKSITTKKQLLCQCHRCQKRKKRMLQKMRDCYGYHE